MPGPVNLTPIGATAAAKQSRQASSSDLTTSAFVLVESSSALTYHRRALADRRHSTKHPSRVIADPQPPVELELRVARLEILVKGLREEIAMCRRHRAAMRAELDHS